ncbi:PD-(D/E)XK nuclease family protein [Deinococcus fonticola]|uniref:PD-(D/E)XK nuclease family protein n=1 Tax=Deinococcus fonticola TaxID=2528713 RepID=UPI00107505F0|nr:PD-(D/E)XK nuclease family protein [Deinococcus fonticola]
MQGGVANLDIQLPLYMLALGAAQGGHLSVQKAEVLQGAGTSAEGSRRRYKWDIHQEQMKAFLQELGEALAQGDVAPNPDIKRKVCTFCHLKAACRNRGMVTL